MGYFRLGGPVHPGQGDRQWAAYLPAVLLVVWALIRSMT